MHIAYFDESVDDEFFVLAAVLVKEDHWRENLDAALALRRRARTRFGIPITVEIKATHIRGGGGPIYPLAWSVDKRGQLLNTLLAWQAKHLQTKVFAVAIHKAKLTTPADPRDLAWRYTLERLDTFCRKEPSNAVMYPDAGHGFFIRKLVRKMRRFSLIEGRYGGVLDRKCERIIEDPSDRHSHESLFIQLADWNAFAALRSRYLAPRVASFATAWDQLGGSLLEVEKLTRPPHVPGMKIFPK
jgi:hypothetical protein